MPRAASKCSAACQAIAASSFSKAPAHRASPVRDARGLRRGVCAQAELAAAHLVDELEGLQVEVAAGARQQRLDMLEQRRHHQLIAVALCAIEQPAPHRLDAAGLRGQHVGDVLRQQPGRHHAKSTGS
jgi:hypothetical protein